MKVYRIQACANGKGGVETSSDYVDAKVLTANVAKSFFKPIGARFVRLTGDAQFYMNPNGVAAVPASDTDGTASVVVGAGLSRTFIVEELAVISVVSTTAATVTAEWFS